MHKTILSTAVGALLLGLAGTAFAQATTVKVGWVNVDPKSSATNVVGPFTPVDTLSTNIKPQSTVFFSIAQALDANWEAEFAAGIPPVHEATLVVNNPAAVPPSAAAMAGSVISKVRQVAPTLFMNYKFGNSSSAYRPFIGLGVNFTRFDKAESTSANDMVNGGVTTIKMSDSKGIAAQVGVTAKLSGPWTLTGVWSTAQVKSTITTNTLGIERTLDVKFNPSVLTLAVGYSF
jgi:outer membrane protein